MKSAGSGSHGPESERLRYGSNICMSIENPKNFLSHVRRVTCRPDGQNDPAFKRDMETSAQIRTSGFNRECGH